MRQLLAATLITAAATLASINTASASTLAASASAQAQSMLDMEAIHKAYFQMPEGAPASALSWFEEQVNRVNHGSDFISIAAQRASLPSGQPVTVLSGYIDRDGVPGLNAGSDQVLFRFVQTAPVSSRGLSYEFVDGAGVVHYRGIRALPASAYYRAYYLGIGARSPFISYYTPYSRLGYLRSWRVGFRATPAYGTWYRGYVAARPYYTGRIAQYRRTYGVSVGLRGLSFRAGYSGRAAVRGTTVRSTTVRTTVRPAAYGRSVTSRSVTSTVRRGPVARTTVRSTTTVSSRRGTAVASRTTTTTRSARGRF